VGFHTPRVHRCSPYNFYFGKKGTDRKRNVFSEVIAQQHAKMEYGVLAAQLFSIKAQKLSKDSLLTKEELRYAMTIGMSQRNIILCYKVASMLH
jgi:hypothetical protein